MQHSRHRSEREAVQCACHERSRDLVAVGILRFEFGQLNSFLHSGRCACGQCIYISSACSTKIEQDTTQTRTYIASSSVSNIMYALGARSCACTPQLGHRFVSCVWAGAPPHGGADHVCFNHEAPCSGSPVSVRTNFSLVIYILMEGPSNFSIFLFGVSFGLHWFVLSVIILAHISFYWYILVCIGLYWFILVYMGLYWFISVYIGLSWRPIIDA